MDQPPKQSSNRTVIITGVIVIILAVGLFTNGFGILGRTVSDPNGVLSIGNSPVLGNLDAPVTIYEFTDFSCPFCAAADGNNPQLENALKANDPSWEAPLPLIEEQYVKTGKVKIVFKYSPGHGTGEPAHLVALALQEQGLFWEFYDQAFANQEDTQDLVKMKDLARQIGANMTQLETSLSQNLSKYKAQLKEDTQMARGAGVRGTPSFIINGQKIEGAASFSEFKTIIDNQLSYRR